MEPVLLVLAVSTGAALAAALGVLPLVGRDEPPAAWLGWANALAAGMMLASAFALSERSISPQTWPFALGATAAIVFVHATRTFSQTEELRLNQLGESAPEYGYEVLLVASLHSAAEGVAIGAAMATTPTFGIFVATALALHNIPEGTLLAAVFRSRGVPVAPATSLAVVSNFGQVLMAVATFAIVTASPPVLPWALGFATGALAYLVMVDLLPESYEQIGAKSIAFAVILALWAFGLLRTVLVA
jgi:zinc transporter ZupT